MHELVGMQTYMYMAEKHGAGQMFALCASVIVPRKIDDAELKRAANELFKINDGLRSRFIDGADGKTYQEVMPYEEQDFEVLHFKSREKMDAWGKVYGTVPIKLDIRSEIPESEEKKDKKGAAKKGASVSPALIMHGIAHAIATKAKAKRLGVGEEVGCCKIRLVQLPNASGAIVKVHHIVADGWGMMLLANQFLQLLKGQEPLAFQFDEHLEKEAKYKESRVYQRDLAYFEDMFKEHPEMPKEFKKAATSMVGKRTTATLDKDFSTAVREYADAHNTSPHILFMAASAAFVRQELGADKFYLGSVCANRAGIKERNTVGLFVNTPSLPVDINGNYTFADVVSKIQDANFSVFRHQRAANDTSVRFPQAFTVSYQIAALEADSTAICTQYWCEYMPAQEDAAGMITIEDRQNEGSFKLHRDHNVQRLSKKNAMKGNLFILKVLREGIADDSKTIDELSA